MEGRLLEIDALNGAALAIDGFGQAGLAIGIMTLMFAIALGLTVQSFAFLKTDPRLFWGGLAMQVIGLPAATIILLLIINPPPSLALGMIFVAACPGGSVSNFMTYLSRGDIAYSVSLTAGSSVLATLWTPFAILLWSDLYPPTAALLETLDFSRKAFIMQTTFMLAIPLAAGMAISRFMPDFAARAQKPLALLGGGTLAFIILRSTFDFLPAVGAAMAIITPLVVLHNAVAFGLGLATGRLLNANTARRRTLTFEIGIQNTGLALVLLIGQLTGLGGAIALAAVWGVWHFASGGAMIAFYRNQDNNGSVSP